MNTVIGNLLIQTVHRSRLKMTDGIRTTHSDTLGTVTVRVKSMQPVTARSLGFVGVSVDTTGQYNGWTKEDLKTEASRILLDRCVEAV